MEKILYLRFDQFMGRFGLIVGALIILAAIAGLIFAYCWGRVPRAGLIALIAALAVGSLLFGPSAPRIANALWRLVALPPPPGPSGPLPIRTARVKLAPTARMGGEIVAQIWFPAAAEALDRAHVPATLPAPIDCASLRQIRLAAPPPSRFPVLLYAPSISGRGDDNASTAASLASHGYIVVAIDDIDLGRPAESAILPFFDFSSEAAYAATLRRGAEKAVLEADRALEALDRLEACVGDSWQARVQFDRIGFFGFSFGGAVAAMASILDQRVAAAANIDGFVFGPALTGSIEKPYMLLIDDEPAPSAQSLQSPDPGKRFYANLAQQFLREHGRLVESPHNHGFRFRDVTHPAFSDWAFSKEAFRSWLFADPARIKAIKDAYLLAFFDTYLRGVPQPLLTQSPSPYRGIDVLKGRPHWFDGEEKVEFG
jgi:dienelactone hydrolase